MGWQIQMNSDGFGYSLYLILVLDEWVNRQHEMLSFLIEGKNILLLMGD